MKECSKCLSCYDDDVANCPKDNNYLTFTITGSSTISGRYVLDKRLGQGGMGVVFKAKHKFLKSLHAIKIILPSLVTDDKSLLVRFRQEAILAASIDHPNVIRVTDFGVENDIMPFLVMEFVSGTALSHYLMDGRPLPLHEAYSFFLPIALGVAEAHRKGIVHRDIKPQNIMVQQGLPPRKAVKVLDFGLAKIKSSDSFPSLIQAKTLNVLGSPPYMSPEQWSGEGVDHRTDIYALGVLFYQMVTGKLPFKADSMPAMMYQHLTVAPPTAASLGVSLAGSIEAVIQKSLQKEPQHRYDSLDTMLTELDRAVSEVSALTSAETQHLTPPSPSRSRIPKPADTVVDLSDSQKEKLYSYFGSGGKPELLANAPLAHEFLDAQERAEQAKTEAVNADLLVQELAAAQKQAEQAQERALLARQRIEADVRRQVEAEMERLVAEEQTKREAEARRIAEEVEARKRAEERANYLAQSALEAQRLAEDERKKREQEAQQRELHEGVRRQAEIAAQQLAQQVTEARKQYVEARNDAAREARFREEAEARRQKIEGELQAVAKSEVERRKLIEAEAKKQIQEQASRFEKEAIAAQQRLEEAKRLIDFEAQKREQAEAARIQAEGEARRLAQEIIRVQQQMQELQQNTTADSQARNATLESLRTGGVPISSGSSFGDSARNVGSSISQPGDTIASLTETTHAHGNSPSVEIPFALLNTRGTSGKRTILLSIAGIFGILLLAGTGIGIYSIYFRTAAGDIDRQIADNARNSNESKSRASEPREIVMIEGGAFQMGRSDISDRYDEFWGNQYPAHPVTVNTFYLDKTETTNEQYAEFVTDRNYRAPSYWINGRVPVGQEKFPVTDVTFNDARAYADWISKRENKDCHLPTEEQWEYAARNGAQSTTFPWGNSWSEGTAVLSVRVAAVGSSGDMTASGIRDMLGNVSEWTSSKLALYRGHDGDRSQDNKYIAVRGLNWYTPQNLLRKPNWLLTYRNPTPEDERNPYLGFRLACGP